MAQGWPWEDRVMQALTLPSSVAKGGWECNPSAIREAMDVLCVKWPVIVKLSAGIRKSGGHRTEPVGYTTDPDGTRRIEYQHVITVTTYEDSQEADRTLWHELTHASQVERHKGTDDVARSWHAEYTTETRRHGRGYNAYWNNKYEVEARENGDEMAPDYPLTRQRRAPQRQSEPVRGVRSVPFGSREADRMFRDMYADLQRRKAEA
jgi:hypothetical protein